MKVRKEVGIGESRELTRIVCPLSRGAIDVLKPARGNEFVEVIVAVLAAVLAAILFVLLVPRCSYSTTIRRSNLYSKRNLWVNR